MSIPEPPSLARPSAGLFGTPVSDLLVEPGEDVLVVSDLHLRPDSGPHQQAFEALLSVRPTGSLTLILGDLFDYWVGRPQLRQPAWRPVPDALARAAERGVRVYVCHGNRDFQMDRAFERVTGARVVPGGLRLVAPGSRPLLCLHGDELCQNDVRYQKSKRMLRSFWARALLHHLPFALSRRLADTARKRSQASVRKADQTELRPSAAAIEQVRRLGEPDLLFGHIHLAARGPIPGAGEPREYFVLPAFEAGDAGHARWTPGRHPRLVIGGLERPWPGPCALSD